jgi:hypothetical protein
MKTFVKFLLMFAIVAALVLWWSPDLRKDVNGLLRDTGLESSAVTLYKWQDQQGGWHYTQDPPPEGTPYEEVEARSDVNVLPLPEPLKTDR